MGIFVGEVLATGDREKDIEVTRQFSQAGALQGSDEGASHVPPSPVVLDDGSVPTPQGLAHRSTVTIGHALACIGNVVAMS